MSPGCGKQMGVREPIVVVLGHVDSGKTSLLDKIRGTFVAMREAGGITQHVGASLIPAEVIVRVAKTLNIRLEEKLRVPGILFIDTPGHEAFVNLRRRGGSIADFAILVIDLVKGVEPQTVESLDILRTRRTPFLIAANKIDLLPGWRPQGVLSVLQSLSKQDERVRRSLDEHLYRIIGDLSTMGFRSDRFDRLTDFRRNVAIVPVSALTGEGVSELIAVLIGLVQQFLISGLEYTEGPARGVVLEVVEEMGMGITVNAIIFDGVLRSGDTIVLMGLNKPIVTKVRALLMPKPLDEMRDPRDRFNQVEEVRPSAGVKIVAPNLEDALPGSPLTVASGNIEEAVEKIRAEVESIRIRSGEEGVVVKADTLGSLEAIVGELEKKSVPVRLGDLGPVSERDVIEASISSKDPTLRVLLAFNVRLMPEAVEEARRRNVPVFQGKIIYRLIEEFLEWRRLEKQREASMQLEQIILPGRIRILPAYVFRRSKPAIVGVKVEAGCIKPGYPLINSKGEKIGVIEQIQKEGKSIPKAEAGEEVAISIPEGIVGRNLREDDVLLVDVPSKDASLVNRVFKEQLEPHYFQALDEVTRLKKKENPFYGL
ncbi:MAG: translation initiation factor IF-2 [Thaumarchaeota archaeon]|jgi:translation initiation factor 5B|nr:translation initiation factor IF-2 [Nitrososphaerota archaeon]